MNDKAAPAAHLADQSYYLVGNGALLMLVGLLVGVTVGAAPHPRLMLTAHIQFLVNGMMSVFAALVLATSLSIVGRRSGVLVVWAHVLTWAVCLSEVAAAIWGATQALPIAGAQAGATGAAPWQEALVLVSHVIPAVFLIAAWAVLVAGVFRARGGRQLSEGQ